MTVERRPAHDRAVLEQCVVREEDVPERLDRLATKGLAAFPTRASARKAAKRGELAVDGEISEPSRWVPAGSVIAWLEPEAHRIPVLPIAVPVVYEDACMAVVHKPSGLATSGALPRTLERTLPHNLSPSSLPDALRRPRPVHRLDAPTAGLVVVAKTRTAHAALGHAFQRREVHKRYRAVLVGRLEGEGRVELPVEGRAAESDYRAIGHGRSLRSGWITRVDLWPRTGRTHQLRRHMAHLGVPILGDGAYGIDGWILKGKGVFLFALELRLAHPTSGAPLHLQIPEPAKVASLFAREARRWRRHHPEAPG